MNLRDKIRLLTLFTLLSSSTLIQAQSKEEQATPASESAATATTPVPDTSDFTAVKIKALDLAEKNDLANAEKLFQDYLNDHPNFAPAMIYLAFIYGNEQKFQEEIDLSEQATKLDPDNYQPYLNIALANIGLKNDDLAKENFTKAYDLAKSKNNVFGQVLTAMNLAVFYGIAQSFEEAQKWAEVSMAAAPADVVAGKAVPSDLKLDEFDQKLLVRAYKGAVVLDAKALHGMKQDAKAIEILEKHLQVYPDDADAKSTLDALKTVSK